MSGKSLPDERYVRTAAEFGAALERLAHAYEVDPELRRDLLQDIHVALWQSLARFKATLIEPEGEPKKFRVTVPSSLHPRGPRIIIDMEPEINSSFFSCSANTCMADYEATPELVDKLKKGHMLQIQVGGLAPMIPVLLPLVDSSGITFARANEGPPTDPKSFPGGATKKGAREAAALLRPRPELRVTISVGFGEAILVSTVLAAISVWLLARVLKGRCCRQLSWPLPLARKSSDTFAVLPRTGGLPAPLDRVKGHHERRIVQRTRQSPPVGRSKHPNSGEALVDARRCRRTAGWTTEAPLVRRAIPACL
jgi:hypothetical protein